VVVGIGRQDEPVVMRQVHGASPVGSLGPLGRLPGRGLPVGWYVAAWELAAAGLERPQESDLARQALGRF
jgi:hypothetical protein